MQRREFLRLTGAAAAATGLARLSRPASAQGASPARDARPDYTVRIATGPVELAPDRFVSTTTYNGQFPGPLLRFKEGQRAVVDIINDTDTPEQLHWHGQRLPIEVDGAAEEGTPFIPARGRRREIFVPGPAGFRFYHTHVRAGPDLAQGQYSGQVGPVYIEPRHERGDYDREIFLVLKEFEPYFMRGGDMSMEMLAGTPDLRELKELGAKGDREAGNAPKGYEVSYRSFAINGRMLGHGEPLRVKPGERVLLHVLNGSATELRSLALPGHRFEVVALDGNPVPRPASVPVLWLGTAERVSAIVEMNHPGIWILGDVSDDDRKNGMGMVVEYAGHKGKPRWEKPRPARWDYTAFATPGATARAPDQTFAMTFTKAQAAEEGFNRWSINGVPFSMDRMEPLFRIRQGKRYRLHLRNASDDLHPLHLHRHSFELTRFAGKATAGLLKDVVMLGGFQELEVDFVADNPGMTLFHCHQQIHMDFGFMALFDYA